MPAGTALPGSVVAGVLGSTSTTVYVIVVVLVAVGLAMIAVAAWLVRATRRDHVVLGPLERMGDRSWRRHDPDRRRRELDEVRPPGAPIARADRPAAAAGPDPLASGAVALAPESRGDADAEAQASEAPIGEEAPAVPEGDAGTIDGGTKAGEAEHGPHPAQPAGSSGDRESTPTGTAQPVRARCDQEPDG